MNKDSSKTRFLALTPFALVSVQEVEHTRQLAPTKQIVSVRNLSEDEARELRGADFAAANVSPQQYPATKYSDKGRTLTFCFALGIVAYLR